MSRAAYCLLRGAVRERMRVCAYVCGIACVMCVMCRPMCFVSRVIGGGWGGQGVVVERG